MPINFIPNDPLTVSSVPMRKVTPRANRPATRAGFKFTNTAAEGRFAPGTPEFLFWQCREAALLALEVWETLNGNLTQWARASSPGKRTLNLIQDKGQQLNAFYDRNSLQFFHNITGNKTTFSGASTDVVSHEAGHAFLDTVRPELFGSAVTEQSAFHEAFGDCMAMVTALSDRASRQALLAASPNLGNENFLEAVMEDLADGVKRALGATHGAAAPRHAFNNFQFQLPTSLPTNGPPAVLTREVHSFGRVFSGCFYDTVRNIFLALPNQTEAALLQATQTAMKLLIAGAKNAPIGTRFFQAVGRAMALEDVAVNGGANRQAVTDAFARHNIPLGSMAMLAPRATLAGPTPNLKRRGALSAVTMRDLRHRISAAPGVRMAVNLVEIGDEKVAEVVHPREVSLTGLDSRLKGVVAVTDEPVLIKAEGAMAAVASALPDESTSTDEVHAFVETLLEHDRISFDGERRTTKRATSKRRSAAAVSSDDEELVDLPTHVIETRGSKKTLKRIRFLCGHFG